MTDDQRKTLQAHVRHCVACERLQDQLQLLRATALPGGRPCGNGQTH